MNNWNSSYVGLRQDLIKYISKSQDNLILDVGCATGVNGKYLLDQKMAKVVYGIEFDPEMAREAHESGIKIIEGDLNNSAFFEALVEKLPLFDYIIFGDILEHLYFPEKTLCKLTKNLRRGGKIILSLPNVSHIELFIQVYIKGSWPLNQRGIFDKTHIRWFTKNDAFRLVEKCGLEIQIYEPNLRARDRIGSTFNWKLKLIRAINKEWVTFQHVIVCQHAK